MTTQERLFAILNAHKRGQLTGRDFENELLNLIEQHSYSVIQQHLETERRTMIRDTFMRSFVALFTTQLYDLKSVIPADCVESKTGDIVFVGEIAELWDDYQERTMGWRYRIFGKTQQVPRYDLVKARYAIRTAFEVARHAFKAYNAGVIAEQEAEQEAERKRLEEIKKREAEREKKFENPPSPVGDMPEPPSRAFKEATSQNADLAKAPMQVVRKGNKRGKDTGDSKKG